MAEWSPHLRDPANSLNPILAAQAQKYHQLHALGLAARPTGEQNRLKAPLESSLAGLLAQAVVQYAVSERYLTAARGTPAQQRARQLLALLSFLYSAERISRRAKKVTVEADSSSSMEDRKPRRPGRRGSSRFRGLSWHKTVGKWAVQLRISGQNQQLGYYSNEEDAAKVYDHYVILTRPPDAPTNFPRPPSGQGYDVQALASKKRRRSSSNGRRGPGGEGQADSPPEAGEGVTFDRARKLWRAHVSLNGKVKWLGFYPGPEEAGKARSQALLDHSLANSGRLSYVREAASAKPSRSGSLGNSSAGVSDCDGQEGSPPPPAMAPILCRKPHSGDESGFDVPVEAERRKQAAEAMKEAARIPARNQRSDETQAGANGTGSRQPGIWGGSGMPANELPTPLPRARQRKPDKRRRPEPSEEATPPPQPAGPVIRGRGRPRGRGLGMAGSEPVILDRRKRQRTHSVASKAAISIFKGVRWDAEVGRWQATVEAGDGQVVELGSFDDEEDAAKAFDRAAIERGRLSDLNFPELKHRHRRKSPPHHERPHDQTASLLAPSSGVSRHAAPDLAKDALAVSGAAALAKFGRVFEKQLSTKEAKQRNATGEEIESEWESDVPAKRRRTQRGRARGRPPKGMQPGRGRHSQANENDDIHPPYKRRALAPSGGRRRGGTIGQQRRKSGFHGVQFEHRSGLWLAEFRHHGKTEFLGRFETEHAASKAVEKAEQAIDGRKRRVEPDVSSDGPSEVSESESEAGGSDEEGLLPPVPAWGRRVRLATHQTPAAGLVQLHKLVTKSPIKRRGSEHKSRVRTEAIVSPKESLLAPAKPDRGGSPPVPHALPAPKAAVTKSRSAAPQPPANAGSSAQPMVSGVPPLPLPSAQDSFGSAGWLKDAKAGRTPPPASAAAGPALGPLRLVESNGKLHLESADAQTRAAIQSALRQPGSSALPAPAQRSSEHVLTIPEKTVPAVWSALQGPKLLTSGELLKIVGAAGPNVPSPPLVLPEASTASPAGLPLLPTNAPSQLRGSLGLNGLPAASSMGGGNLLGQQLRSIIAGAAAKTGEDKEAISEATRSAYAALLQQHTAALTTALARARAGHFDSDTQLQEQPDEAGSLPEGLKGPNIPAALRNSQGKPPAIALPQEQSRAFRAVEPLARPQKPTAQLPARRGPPPSDRPPLPLKGGHSAPPPHLKTGAGSHQGAPPTHGSGLVGSDKFSGPGGHSTLRFQGPNNQLPPPYNSAAAQGMLGGKSWEGSSKPLQRMESDPPQSHGPQRGAAMQRPAIGVPVMPPSGKPVAQFSQQLPWSSQPVPMSFATAGLSRIVSSATASSRPLPASAKPSPSRVTSGQPAWPPGSHPGPPGSGGSAERAASGEPFAVTRQATASASLDDARSSKSTSAGRSEPPRARDEDRDAPAQSRLSAGQPAPPEPTPVVQPPTTAALLAAHGLTAEHIRQFTRVLTLLRHPGATLLDTQGSAQPTLVQQPVRQSEAGAEDRDVRTRPIEIKLPAAALGQNDAAAPERTHSSSGNARPAKPGSRTSEETLSAKTQSEPRRAVSVDSRIDREDRACKSSLGPPGKEP